MPLLIRFYIKHVAIGFAISFVFTAFVIAFDFGGVGYLISNVDGGWLAGFLFFMLNGIVFAGVQFGIAVMRKAAPDDEGPRGPRNLERRYATIPVVSKRRR